MITTSKDTTISNDGATVLGLLDIEHAAAKILVDIAKSQDNEVGDGTTTVTILAGELMKNAKGFIEDGMNPQVVMRGYKRALEVCLAKLNSLIIKIDETADKKRDMLIKCAETALNSKLLSHYKNFFAEIVVSAVEKLDTHLLDKDLIGIKEVTGGSIRESFLVSGVAFQKTFSYAGFEQQPKKFTNPKILILKIELELKSEKENAEIRIENVDDFQSIVDAEWQIIYDKLQKMHDVGANIVLSKLPIGDLATQWFADRGIFCAGRVPNEDINRVSKATGAVLQTTVNNLTPDVLGTCGKFEEKQIGAERYNLFEECPSTKSATIILRGGAEQFIKEAERSLNDAIMIVRRCFKTNKVVAGGGATEMELSRALKEEAVKVAGKEQLVMNMFAKSLEAIPKIIADNAGLDSLDIINKLRHKHGTYLNNSAKGGEENIYLGVDINTGIGNSFETFVWEPAVVKINALKAATEAACTILSIDETVRNPKA